MNNTVINRTNPLNYANNVLLLIESGNWCSNNKTICHWVNPSYCDPIHHCDDCVLIHILGWKFISNFHPRTYQESLSLLEDLASLHTPISGF
jgi:hypothetical protein